MTVPRVQLGSLVTPAQGFGAMALAEVYGAADDTESLATIHHAIDVGATLIDTADVYGAGRNELLVARVLAGRRDEVVLATKFGILPEHDSDGRKVRGDADYVRASVDASLSRLRVNEIDLYYYHRVDPRVEIEETVGALAGLVAAGKIRHIGLSEVTAAELDRAAAVHPIAAVQSEWSIFSRDVEEHVIPAARRLGVGFVAYSPLGRGLLAAKAPGVIPDGDLRRRFPRFSPDNLAANQQIAETVRRVAGAEGLTPAQLALAWIYQRARSLDVVVVPIPGTRRAARVDENLVAVGVTLSAAGIDEVNDLAVRVVGERSPDPASVSLGRERA